VPETRALLLLAVLLGASPLAAQELRQADNDPRVREVASRLACYCGCSTQSIADCTCGVASKSRGEILASLEEGASVQHVVDSWVERFGARILLEPPRQGFNLLGWFLPGAVLLASGLMLVLALRRWRGRTVEAVAIGATAKPLDPRYLEQLERELQELEP
jgi:cytochrome c-type biogenesis protein CcmH